MVRKGESYYKQEVLNKYKNVDYISYKCLIEEDGYDNEGPESQLYTLYIFSKKGGTAHLDIFEREDWYDEDDEEYILFKSVEGDDALRIGKKLGLIE